MKRSILCWRYQRHVNEREENANFTFYTDLRRANEWGEVKNEKQNVDKHEKTLAKPKQQQQQQYKMKLFHQRLDVTKNAHIQTEHLFKRNHFVFEPNKCKSFSCILKMLIKIFYYIENETECAMVSFHTRPKWSCYSGNKEQISFINAVSDSFHFDEMQHNRYTNTLFLLGRNRKW